MTLTLLSKLSTKQGLPIVWTTSSDARQTRACPLSGPDLTQVLTPIRGFPLSSRLSLHRMQRAPSRSWHLRYMLISWLYSRSNTLGVPFYVQLSTVASMPCSVIRSLHLPLPTPPTPTYCLCLPFVVYRAINCKICERLRRVKLYNAALDDPAHEGLKIT